MSDTVAGIPEQHLFGAWRFNANSGELFDGKTTTHLEPQVAKLLDYFLNHQDTLTSRDVLMAEVWDNRIVSDDAINRCISILRQILTPDDRNAYIETVVRRGFVSHFPPAPDAERPAEKSSWRGKYTIVLVMVLLLVVMLYSYTQTFDHFPPTLRDAQPDGPPMIAVLPFTYTGVDDDSEEFASGIHDDLLTQLSQLQSMRVISRTSVQPYKNTEQNLREIGFALGADAILEGGIQRIGDQIRINAQLIDARTDTHLWAGQYDRELSPAHIFEVQSEITRAIARELQASLTARDDQQLRVLPTENMAAYRAYHRALKIRDVLSIDEPTYGESLEAAVTLDPSFTRAWAELAGLLSYRNFGQQDPASIRQLEQILEKIRTLAPGSADYLIAQAFYTYYVMRDYDQAYRLVSQAQNLRPSDERLLELKSNIQRRQGDFAGKIESTRLARTLDPKNPIWTNSLIVNLIVTHQYDEASRELEQLGDQDFDLAAMRRRLQLREHHDVDQWAEDLNTLQSEFRGATNPIDLWESNIAIRDYAKAEELVAEIQLSNDPDYRSTVPKLVGVDIYQLITYWLLQSTEQLEPFLVQTRARLDQWENSGEVLRPDLQPLVMALITAAEGKTEETERLVRAWQRESHNDLAHLAISWHIACRALGMAAATTAAVDCIRSALVEPSYVMPFLEPILPYYDSIRDEPEFVALVDELQDAPERR